MSFKPGDRAVVGYIPRQFIGYPPWIDYSGIEVVLVGQSLGYNGRWVTEPQLFTATGVPIELDANWLIPKEWS